VKTSLKFLLIVAFLLPVCWLLLYHNDDNDNNLNYYATTGESNGNFFGEKVFVKQVDIKSLVVGDFIVFERDGNRILHPITSIIRAQNKTVAFETKGLKNEIKDSTVMPNQIIGKAYRVLDNGLIEKDTKSPESLH